MLNYIYNFFWFIIIPLHLTLLNYLLPAKYVISLIYLRILRTFNNLPCIIERLLLEKKRFTICESHFLWFFNEVLNSLKK